MLFPVFYGYSGRFAGSKKARYILVLLPIELIARHILLQITARPDSSRFSAQIAGNDCFISWYMAAENVAHGVRFKSRFSGELGKRLSFFHTNRSFNLLRMPVLVFY
uniref:Uncharacterized protein n=1 Tax=Myoviridae sp. ctrMq22 TaxID=2825181 RepID=A0A8S5NVZ0_9CAUD|nr:MAG TPA: hypothetical protein [Myoviridae sp. ctrMq22]